MMYASAVIMQGSSLELAAITRTSSIIVCSQRTHQASRLTALGSTFGHSLGMYEAADTEVALHFCTPVSGDCLLSYTETSWVDQPLVQWWQVASPHSLPVQRP